MLFKLLRCFSGKFQISYVNLHSAVSHSSHMLLWFFQVFLFHISWMLTMLFKLLCCFSGMFQISYVNLHFAVSHSSNMLLWFFQVFLFHISWMLMMLSKLLCCFSISSSWSMVFLLLITHEVQFFERFWRIFQLCHFFPLVFFNSLYSMLLVLTDVSLHNISGMLTMLCRLLRC